MSNNPRPPSKRLTRLMLMLGVAGSLTWAVAGGMLESIPLPGAILRLTGTSVVILAASLLMITLILRRSTGALLGLFVVELVLTIAGFVSYHPPMRGEMLLAVEYSIFPGKRREHTPEVPPRNPTRFATRPFKPAGPISYVSEDEWFEQIRVSHPIFGHLNTPGVMGRHVFRGVFDVTYRTDDEGFRIMPEPVGKGPFPEIWFVGCSYTYGECVDDHESYPAVLALEAWPDHRVRNFSCPAWGTAHSLVTLETKLAGAQSMPRLVCYGFIQHHLARNYLRRSWRSVFNTPFPHFEMSDGHLRFLGVDPFDVGTREDSAELDAEEAALTGAMIERMDALCKERGIPFVVLSLHDAGEPIESLMADGHVPVWQVHKFISNEFHPREGHPTRFGQREIAEYIADRAPFSELDEKLNDLHRPGSVKSVEPHWALSTNRWGGTLAWIAPIDHDVTRARVWGIEGPNRMTRQPRLQFRPFDWKAGSAYAVRLRLRSDRPGAIEGWICDVDHPWTVRTKQPIRISLTGEWQEVAVPAIAMTEDRRLQLELDLSTFEGELEIDTPDIEVGAAP